MKDVMTLSKLPAVSSILDEIMYLVQKSEIKFAMGMQEVRNPTSLKSYSHIVPSDSIFNTTAEVMLS